MHSFVQAVLERLATGADETIDRLRSNWRAVCESRVSERDLCSWSASLGLDPYDEYELTDDLVNVMQSRVGRLPPNLRDDLVHAATSSSLEVDLDWLDRAAGDLPLKTVGRREIVPNRSLTAHQFGYERAALVRQEYALPAEPISDLKLHLHEHCGWPAPELQLAEVVGTTSIRALVARDSAGKPRVVGPPLKPWADRFRLARAAYFQSRTANETSPRLVTNAFDWDQRASRAFAAELLAPAEALRSRLGNVVSADQVDDLAQEFDVRPILIEHQIKNHRLAVIDED